MANKALETLRQMMAERSIDIYIVPTADFHNSEYAGEYFRCRKFLTGFTGSAGVALVTQEKAALFTDGRYFIQAAKEIENTGFELYKMGVQGVPTVNELAEELLPAGGVIGFDGRVVDASWGMKLEGIAKEKGGSLSVSEDLVGLIWEDRPELISEPAWILSEKYAGESIQSKIKRIREFMKNEKVGVYVLTSLDDIAWVLNLRGNDIPHFPVTLSYLLMTAKGCIYYAKPSAITSEVRAYLTANGVQVAGYEDIYAMADRIGDNPVGRVLMDMTQVNYRLYKAISKSNEIVNRINPTVKMKAIKNPTELENIKKAHVKDGVAMVNWLYWLDQAMEEEVLTEVSVSDKLQEFRAEQEGFLDLSFETIAAYEANAAMMHYSATPENFSVIEPKGFLLVDCGGHYMEGSTDITRTIAMGPITDEQREYFTTVLQCNLNLAAAKFLYGCTGNNLDILARGPLWTKGIDYRCGTGHGVGYLLSIHEPPNGFRWKIVPERNDSAALEAGMVTTDEPGVYFEDKYGIRTENELVLRKDEVNEYGQFMSFETITYCPIDLDAVDPEMLTKREKALLNEYHKMVYETLSPYLKPEVKMWLKYETRSI